MLNLPIVSVVGYSNSGKTRCLVELISLLTRRGYRIASAKHCHDGFDLDIKGKDSWKHKQAGAAGTLMSGRGQIALISDLSAPLTLGQIYQRFFSDADLLLAEGYSWEPFLKILVVSCDRLEQEKIRPDDPLLALVGEKRLDSPLPQFSFDELDELASLLEQRLLLPRLLASPSPV
jgi:molybdopterin-guanine dinucleotide biosynthesis protein B